MPKLHRLTLLMVIVILVLTACGQGTPAPATSVPATSVPATSAPVATALPATQVVPGSATQAPATAAPAGEHPQGGTITYTNLEPATLNPYLRPEQVAWQAIALISTGLVDLNDKGEWVLELATDLPSVDNRQLSADGLTVTWKLRPGLKWSDGEPLTSDDLRFTWEVCSNPASGCALNGGFDKIASVETPDDQTITLHYKEIYPAWLAQFRNGILPRHGTGKAEDLLKWEWNRTVNPTNGPFIVKEWVPSDHITFVRNPNYWEAGKPYLDQINWKVVPDFEVQRQMLLGGESQLDVWVAGEPQVIETAKAGFTMGGGQTPYWNRIQFNLWDPKDLTKPHPLLGDVRVRQAILMSIDREKVTYNWNVKGYYQAKLMTSLYDLWPQFACNLPAYNYDPKAAQALLDGAGWKDQDGDGVRECHGCQTAPDGTALRMRVSTYSNWGQEDNELVMVDELKQVGIDLYLQNYEATVMYSSWADGSFMYRGDFDVLWWDHDPGMPDPQFRTESFYTAAYIPSETNPTGMNMSRVSDPEIEQWAKQAGSTVDVEVRHKAYCQIAEKLYKTIASEEVNGTTSNFAFSDPRLKGWAANELYTPFGWDAEDWYWEAS